MEKERRLADRLAQQARFQRAGGRSDTATTSEPESDANSKDAETDELLRELMDELEQDSDEDEIMQKYRAMRIRQMQSER